MVILPHQRRARLWARRLAWLAVCVLAIDCLSVLFWLTWSWYRCSVTAGAGVVESSWWSASEAVNYSPGIRAGLMTPQWDGGRVRLGTQGGHERAVAIPFWIVTGFCALCSFIL